MVAVMVVAKAAVMVVAKAVDWEEADWTVADWEADWTATDSVAAVDSEVHEEEEEVGCACL